MIKRSTNVDYPRGKRKYKSPAYYTRMQSKSKLYFQSNVGTNKNRWYNIAKKYTFKDYGYFKFGLVIPYGYV
tara:strand:- start:1179 stop:1394 length:216 start_codon:yes stop_codon:yes gene_type:complete